MSGLLITGSEPDPNADTVHYMGRPYIKQATHDAEVKRLRDKNRDLNRRTQQADAEIRRLDKLLNITQKELTHARMSEASAWAMARQWAGKDAEESAESKDA